MLRVSRYYLSGHVWHHVTAVQTDVHLARCMGYIDFKMVRTGVVQHHAAWVHAVITRYKPHPIDTC